MAEVPEGLPQGFAGLTVVQLSEAVAGWDRPQVEAALAYERALALTDNMTESAFLERRLREVRTQAAGP